MGFPLWPDNTCGHCGHVDNSGEPPYRLECPECYREGCEECMPMGRGCVCPECEDAERDKDE